MQLGVPELEVIGLCIAVEALDDIANLALLELSGPIGAAGQFEVRYKSREHQQLFLIRLLDFTREHSDGSLTGVTGSCLAVLEAACKSRSFSSDTHFALADATSALRQWLSTETAIRLWLPTLNLEATVNVERRELLFILANHVKHNLSRLTGVSESIAQLLERNGHPVAIHQVPLALDDFRERLQEDYFVYYGTWLAELVNNLRWGIQDYLGDTFRWAYVPGEELAYSYRFPQSISNEIARQWFWRLMNRVRARPYIERFAGVDYLKKWSSGEEAAPSARSHA